MSRNSRTKQLLPLQTICEEEDQENKPTSNAVRFHETLQSSNFAQGHGSLLWKRRESPRTDRSRRTRPSSEVEALNTIVAPNSRLSDVVLVMRRHPRKARVQERGCNRVRVLTARRRTATTTTERTDLAGETVETVVRAMRTHLGVETIQVYGCAAVRNVLAADPAALPSSSDAACETIRAIASALRAHPGSYAVQRNAIDALTHACRTTSSASALLREYEVERVFATSTRLFPSLSEEAEVVLNYALQR